MASPVKPQLVVAEDIAAAALEHFLRVQPRTIALAGGNTPQPFHRRLAGIEYPWEDVDVFFGDERCVPPDDQASNFGKAYESFLSRVPARAHRMPGETCDAEAYERELEAVFGPGVPEFDLMVLGMGEDGHTASLFPGDAALRVMDRNVVRVDRPDYPRLTLTLPVLCASRSVLFLIEGGNKRGPLRRLLSGGDIPAARVRAADVVVIADRAAAT